MNYPAEPPIHPSHKGGIVSYRTRHAFKQAMRAASDAVNESGVRTIGGVVVGRIENGIPTGPRDLPRKSLSEIMADNRRIERTIDQIDEGNRRRHAIEASRRPNRQSIEDRRQSELLKQFGAR